MRSESIRAIGARIAVVTVIAVSACNSAQTATPTSGDTLTISLGQDGGHTDPALTMTVEGNNINEFIAERLTTYVFTGKLDPLLATSWKPNADLTDWTFTLRSGVKFTDGTPFNATVVNQNIQRWLNPQIVMPQFGDLKYIKGADVLDDTHIVIHLNQGVSFFPSVMSGVASAMTSPASWTVQGNTPIMADNVVGTGPYKLAERVQGDHILLQRNDNYWGQKPYYKYQLFKVIPDAATREAAVRSGQVQLIKAPPAPDFDSIRSDSNLVLSLPYGRTIFMGINNLSKTQPLLRDVRVRQALNYAIDRNAIVKNVLFGSGTPDDAGFWTGQFGYCAVGPYTYDPAKAKQLLQDAGASNMKLTMISPTGRYVQDIEASQAIAGYLRAVGITVDGPRPVDGATLLSEALSPPATSDTQLFLFAYSPDFPDAGQVLSHTLTTGAIPPGKGTNVTGYSNPIVDQLADQAAKATDSSATAADYCQAQKLIFADAPEIFLWDQGNPIVYSKKLKGIVMVANGTVNTMYAEPV